MGFPGVGIGDSPRIEDNNETLCENRKLGEHMECQV